jgi:DNA-binding CsgD family transcriptional regulator
MASSIANGPFHRLDLSVQQLLATVPDGSELRGRSREVLAWLLNGLSEKEIAVLLRLSRHTVHGHVKKIYDRYGVESHPQLMAQAYGKAIDALLDALSVGKSQPGTAPTPSVGDPPFRPLERAGETRYTDT